jgi:hypothetical protein
LIDQKNFALLRKFKVYCIQSAQAVVQKMDRVEFLRLLAWCFFSALYKNRCDDVFRMRRGWLAKSEAEFTRILRSRALAQASEMRRYRTPLRFFFPGSGSPFFKRLLSRLDSSSRDFSFFYFLLTRSAD